MKKNISINISGIIFHIEEDGYQKLKEYLESINKYFSTFDGSTEIIADIESRIAEIFLSKLNEGKQVINIDDVTSLIATMGGIQDFQAVEEEIALDNAEESADEGAQEEGTASEEPKKKVYRDKKRKLIGGVAAGIANYLSIDPLWIRLIFILMLFDVFLTFTLSGFIILVYIVLWIVLPESEDLEEDKKLKKMYRNPSERVIGGVASGVAAYFDTDITLIRVLFVLGTFVGGFGLIAYIVLWIILPEAKTITDKVQMKGEAVTLENIESNIKSTQQAKANPKQESVIVRVLLFPFRLIAIILRGLSKAFGPIARFLLEFIRVVVGIALTLLGLSILFGVLISGSAFMGLMAASDLIQISHIPIELLQNIVSPLGFIAGMVVIGIPGLAIMFIGLSIASKTRIPNATVGWAMFAIWLLGIIGVSFTLPGIIYEYRTEGDYTETSYYEIDNKQLVLDIRETGYGEFEGVRLKLRGYDGENIKLVQEYSARGASKKEAIQHAQNIKYEVSQNDSILVFDSNIDYSAEEKLRGQDLMMTLYIPYGQTFIMRNNFDDLIYYSFGYQGFNSSQIIGNTWMFNPSGLDCITCVNYSSSSEQRRENYEDLYSEATKIGSNDSVYTVSEFNEIRLEGPYEAIIVRGDEYRVVLNGYYGYLDKANVSTNENTLEIGYMSDDEIDLNRYNRKIKVKIITPHYAIYV
jgi:phage shock protein PspC (stress-responsive transcriptional regulator)